jgi:hypothetical protein
MSASDWVLVGSTIFLGAVALFVPYLSEAVKRRAFAPRIEIAFRNASPFCIRTLWTSRHDPTLSEPVFFFRLQITNHGKSQARNCEAVLTDLWSYDAAGKPFKFQGFSPINLRIEVPVPTNINTERRFYCAIGHVSSPAYQEHEEKKSFFDFPGKDGHAPRFLFDLETYPNSQPNCLLPGRYAIKVAVYSENSPRKEAFFKVDWSGKWHDDLSLMLRELVIARIGEPASASA